MAPIKQFVNLHLFKGTEVENMEEFFGQLTSCMQVALIPDANCHTYLHLHLKGGALALFDLASSSNSRGLRQCSRSIA